MPGLDLNSFPTNLLSTAHVAAALIPLLAALPYVLFKLPSPTLPPKIHPGLAELPGPDDELRQQLKTFYPENFYDGGAYADLPFGKIRYYLLGGEFSPKLVLISGISVPSPIWKNVIPKLAEHFRILVFDHYGRGWSEAPEVEYNATFYTVVVSLLMQHVGWTKAHVAGMSMGGPIAAAFAVNFPNMVDGKVALLAPVGLLQDEHIPGVPKFFSSPVGLYITTTRIFKSTLRMLYQPSAKSLAGEDVFKLQQVVLPYHIAAVASSIRNGPLRGMDYAYRKLGNSDVKVLVVWGTADTDVPYHLATRVLTYIPRAKLVTVAGAAHDLLMTHPAEVGDAVTEFFRW